MTLVHEIVPLDSMNNLGQWLKRKTPSFKLTTLDAIHNLGLSMIRKTLSREFRALDAMIISGL